MYMFYDSSFKIIMFSGLTRFLEINFLQKERGVYEQVERIVKQTITTLTPLPTRLVEVTLPWTINRCAQNCLHVNKVLPKRFLNI